MKRIFLIAFACILVLVGCASNTLTWQEQYDLGIRYLNEGNYEEAIIAFTAAIEIDQKNVDAYLGRAEAYMNSNDVNGITNALADYTAVIEIDTTCEAAYVGMANAYIKQGNYDKAKEALDKVSDESLKSDLLTEIEKSITETLELSEIQLENISYTFFVDEGIIDLNEGAVGGMCVSANVLAPHNVKTVLIATWGENISEWSQSKIKEQVLWYANMWKDSGVHIDEDRELPYEIAPSHPVDEDELGKHNEVLLIGLDKNCYPVGYTFVKGEIPSKNEALKDIKVIEASNYSRAVNPPSYAGNSSDYEPHSISIPKIDGNSVAINTFNEEILNDYVGYIEELQTTTTEDQFLTYVSYDFGVTDGLVAILVNSARGRFGSSYNISFKGYYYDSTNDEEISFEEYLNRLGVDASKLSSQINNTIQNDGDPWDNEEYVSPDINSDRGIKCAVIKSNEFTVVYEEFYGMGGPRSISIPCEIQNIQK